MTTTAVAERYLTARRHLAAGEAGLSRWFNLLAGARGGAFLTAVVMLWLGAFRGAPRLVWSLVPIAVFVILMIVHETIVRRRERIRRALAWYERAMNRLEDRWAGRGVPGEEYRLPEHLFADDLDLFGPGSLFELLCTAETPAGRSTLALWLQQPARPDQVQRRQAALLELRERAQFRVDLAVIGSTVEGGFDRELLSAWGTAPGAGFPGWAAPAALALAVGNVVALAGAIGFGLSAWLPTAALVISVAFASRFRSRIRATVAAVERPLRDLDHMAGLVARVEAEQWTAPLLVELARRLEASGRPASAALRSLNRLVGLLDSRRNQLFAPVGALLLWTTQLGLALERWRCRHGSRIGEWVIALGEVEALASLATYADEHPDDPMPELVDGPARFSARALVHPLLPRRQAVPNDLALGEGEIRAMVVSGSNMSGKSTLLRAVGVNVVLAQAGAPVSAAALRLSPLAIGASFRPQDSLLQGHSRFFAEIARLRRTVDLLQGDAPVLFLLDELLSGTNSYDRALGARAIVEHLVRAGAIGLLTTHDLALAGIADALAPAMTNVHFEDTLREGTLHFDYRLRSGVVERSNAVELMRAVGLPV